MRLARKTITIHEITKPHEIRQPFRAVSWIVLSLDFRDATYNNPGCPTSRRDRFGIRWFCNSTFFSQEVVGNPCECGANNRRQPE